MSKANTNLFRENFDPTSRKPVCKYRAILAGLSIIFLLCLSSLEPLLSPKPDSKKPSISLLTYQELLKTLVPRNLQVEDEELTLYPARRSEEDFTSDSGGDELEKLFVAIETVNSRLGFKCTAKILDCDEQGSLSRIFAKFEFKDAGGKLQGVLEQSFLVSGDEFTSRIEHVRLPEGRQMSKHIIKETLNALSTLSSNPKNRIELEAASGKSLIGAYVWAKRGFEFLPGERDILEEQLLRYIQSMHPFEPKENVMAWIRQQKLVRPVDFASLPRYEAGESGVLKLILRKLHVRSYLYRRFAKDSSKLGLAFLTDPRAAAHWEGEIRVGEA